MELLPVKRLLKAPDRSFFLFGPRGTGKSTWLKNSLPKALLLDLLDTSLSLELSRSPHRLETLISKRPEGSWIILDEIQKIPLLLDEVHRLIELKKWKFALCGSSARKLKRSGVNLLAGRAITLNMESFSSQELGNDFDPARALEWGTLPFLYNDEKNGKDILSAYLHTYIKEEIREEGVVRSVPPFLRFLAIAGQLNGQSVNGLNISREASVPRSNVDIYFSILEDTLLGHFLPAYQTRSKIREQTHPKFYWFDPGVARAAAGWLYDSVDRLWKGVSLETLIFHELRVYNEISGKKRPVSYYRTGSGSEIDFIVETKKKQHASAPHVVCIEIKLSEKWDPAWGKAMTSLFAQENIKVDRMIGVYMGARASEFNGVDVLPLQEFLKQLFAGDIF